MTALFGLAVAAYLYARQRRLAHLLPPRERSSTVPPVGRPATAGPRFLSVSGHGRTPRATRQPGTGAGRRHPWLHRWCRGRCRTARRLTQARDAAFLTAATAWVYVCVFATTGRVRPVLLVLGSVAFSALAQRDRPEHDPPPTRVRTPRAPAANLARSRT